MLLAAKPTNMTKEKSTLGVDGIGVRFGVLVVDTVVTSPFVDRVLVRDRVAEGEEHAEWELCLVRSVGPEAVDSSGNAEQAQFVRQDGCVGENVVRIVLTCQTKTRLI